MAGEEYWKERIKNYTMKIMKDMKKEKTNPLSSSSSSWSRIRKLCVFASWRENVFSPEGAY
jgi:hypothetical protein